MLADHAARVAARRARLGAEARGAGGEAKRQRLLVDDALADEIGQRDFGGRDEAEPRRPDLGKTIGERRCGLAGRSLQKLAAQRPELILLELRQLRCAEHRRVPHENRRVDLGIAMLDRMQVEHELLERSL